MLVIKRKSANCRNLTVCKTNELIRDSTQPESTHQLQQRQIYAGPVHSAVHHQRLLLVLKEPQLLVE